MFQKIKFIFIFSENYKKSLLLVFIKLLFLLILIYGGLEISIDYLSYPYIYKLEIKSSNGLSLPAITICTESNVLFDKSRINKYFNLSNQYIKYEEIAIQKANEIYKQCMDSYFIYDKIEIKNIICNEIKNSKNYFLNKFYSKYLRQMLEMFSFDNLYENFTINANQLINCSAKYHLKHKSYKNCDKSHTNTDCYELSNNCSQSYRVLESIYGNEFGLCFAYFHTNDGIYLIDNDFIEFNINYETQLKFLINGFFELNFQKLNKIKINENLNQIKSKLYSDDYFILYVFIDKMTKQWKPSKERALKISNVGFDGHLKITKTFVDLLSTPYMQFCGHQGIMFLFILLI